MNEVFRHPNTDKTNDPAQRVIGYQERLPEGIRAEVTRFESLGINPSERRGSDRRIDFLAFDLIVSRVKNPDPHPSI